MREVLIEVSGMHCAACGLLIDDVMLDLDGVKSSVTDTRSGHCRVTVGDSVADEALIAAVAEAGYSGAVV